MADRTIIVAAQPGRVARPVARFGRPEYEISAEARALVAAARARGLTTQEAADALGCTPLEFTQLKLGEKTLDAQRWTAAIARINAASTGTRHRVTQDQLSDMPRADAEALHAALAARLGI